METMFQDLRYTLRQLIKSPGFTATAILTLALGIGANIAVFTVINASLLNPSGVPHPDQVVAVRAKYSFGDLANINISPPDFADAVMGKNIFTSAAVMKNSAFNYSASNSTPERLTGALVSWQWFDVFWARPQLGRVFRPEEDQPAANREVVLSDAAWKRRFGGDPGIIGRTLLLNEESFQVVGVMGPEFNWPNQAELWVPLGLPAASYSDSQLRHNEYLFCAARLRPGVTNAQANAYLALRSAQQIASEPGGYSQAAGWGMFSMPLIDFVAGDLRKPLFLLLAAVALVLLISCANIAGLQLARASGKQREVSIQIALGVSRARLIRSALLESLLLAFGGVICGLVIARTSIPLLLLLAPQSLSRNITIHIGWPILAFVVVVGAACVLFCGVAPAWQMTHSRWFQSLQEGGRSETSGRGRQRLRSALVVTEIAVAMLLLVGSGLLVRSLLQVQQLETGFRPQGLMSATVSLPRTTYKGEEKQAAFYTAVEDQLKNLPGVSSASLSDGLPFDNNGGSSSFNIKGKPVAAEDPGPHGNIRLISPDYFLTLGIPLVRGRFFTSGDRLNTERVAIIDETLARRYWPNNEDPLGQYITFGSKSPDMQIVGLVKHAKTSSLEADNTEGYYYLPIFQSPDGMASIVVRSSGAAPETLASSMQSAVRAVDASLPLYDFKSMNQRVDESLTGRRFLVLLLSAFAGLALLLSAVGLYGVISYSVRMRTRELGIRLALGAQRADVLGLILGKGMQLAAIGLVLGLVSTLAAGRVLSSLLYHTSLLNPLTLLGTIVLLTSTVLFACYVPARRAAALEPMRTLRED